MSMPLRRLKGVRPAFLAAALLLLVMPSPAPAQQTSPSGRIVVDAEGLSFFGLGYDGRIRSPRGSLEASAPELSFFGLGYNGRVRQPRGALSVAAPALIFFGAGHDGSVALLARPPDALSLVGARAAPSANATPPRVAPGAVTVRAPELSFFGLGYDGRIRSPRGSLEASAPELSFFGLGYNGRVRQPRGALSVAAPALVFFGAGHDGSVALLARPPDALSLVGGAP